MTIKDGIYYPLGRAEEMSEGEYQAMFDETYISSRSPNCAVGQWRTRNGSIIKIAEMTTAHLKNAINYFERDGWGKHPKIEELRDELDKRTP